MVNKGFTTEALTQLYNWLSADAANNRDIDNDIETIQDTITFLLQNLNVFDQSHDRKINTLLFNLQMLKDELSSLITLTTLTPQNYGQKRSS